MTPEEIDAEIAMHAATIDQIKANVRDHMNGPDAKSVIIRELVELAERLLNAWQQERAGWPDDEE